MANFVELTHASIFSTAGVITLAAAEKHVRLALEPVWSGNADTRYSIELTRKGRDPLYLENDDKLSFSKSDEHSTFTREQAEAVVLYDIVLNGTKYDLIRVAAK